MYKQLKKVLSQWMVLTLTVTMVFGGSHVQALAGENTTGSRNIDVWDFGGVQTTGNTNHISTSMLEALSDQSSAIVQGGLVKKNITFDDLTVVTTTAGNFFRLNYNKEDGTKGKSSYGNPTIKTFSDGYINRGSIYFSGDGGVTNNYFQLNHVAAGDQIEVYGFGTNGTGPAMANFVLTSGATGQTSIQNTDAVTSAGQKLVYRVLDAGSVKIHFSGSGSFKPQIARIKKIPGVEVSGTLDLGNHAISGQSLVFQNQSTSEILKATLNSNGTFNVNLTAGYTYTAILQGVSSNYMISDTSKTVTTSLSDITNGISNIALVVEDMPLETVTGAISGFESGYNTDVFKMTFTPTESSLVPTVEATINKNSMTYSADIRTGVTYKLAISGVNDYKLATDILVNTEDNLTQDITVVKRMLYTATGTFLGLPSGAAVTSVSFVNVDDDYTYTGQVTQSGTGYNVQLRDGAYAVQAVSSDSTYKTISHVVVSRSNVVKDVKFSTSTPPSDLPLIQDLYVGDSTKANNYTKVSEAIAAASRMKPASESQRITIHITPGVYREQLKVETPYISLVNAAPSQGEVKLTWYYGVGYVYYSADKGYYNEDRAFDKFTKGSADRWGATVYLTNKATSFRAENIVFENSFNRYMTQEELDDGVRVNQADITNPTERTDLNADVAARKYTERAAAIAIEANHAEFYRSKFLSGQDTMYTGGVNIYFNECFIEGNTDYIFGDGNVVFDNSTLNFKGYSDQNSSGYITAPGTNAARLGYLFRNSTISTNNVGGFTGTGYYGRPWGKDAGAKFLDTKLQTASIINPLGWVSMGTNLPENARFAEYNTTFNGLQVDTAPRSQYVLDHEAAVTDVNDYFGSDWTPHYYEQGSVTQPVLYVDSVSPTQVNLGWSDAESNIGSVIYSVYKDGIKLGTTTENTYIVTDLQPSQNHSFNVSVIDTAGNTAESNIVEAITTGQNVSASAALNTISDTQIKLINDIASDSNENTDMSPIETAEDDSIDNHDDSSAGSADNNAAEGADNGSNEESETVTESMENEESVSSDQLMTAMNQNIQLHPEDFVNVDIGNPSTPGSSSFNDDTNQFTLTGSGAGISKLAAGEDHFSMSAAKLKGDFTLSAKATYESGTLGQMGLIIRENLNPNSYHYTQTAQDGFGRVMFRYDNASNGSNVTIPLTGTVYLQLKKVGNNITSIISSAPIPENPVNSETLKISSKRATGLGLDASGNPKELYVGLMVTPAISSPTTLKATFEDVTIVMADGTLAFDSNAGKPVAPKNVSAKPYDQRALIRWEPISTATSYSIKQSTNPAGPFQTVGTAIGSEQREKFIDNLENDQTYYFIVTASNEDGESIESEFATVTPTAASILPTVITMTSEEPDEEVFSAVLPISGTVNKKSVLTIQNNGALIELDGTKTSLSLDADGAFSQNIILSEGVNEIVITATDSYENVTTKSYTVMYTDKITNFGFYIDNQPATTLMPDAEVSVKAEVENHVAEFKDAVMIVGLYDEQGTLVKFIFTVNTITNGDTEMFYAKMKLPDDVSGYSMKAFIWDSFVNMHPVSHVITLKSE